MRPLVPTMPAHGFLSLLCSLACASLAQGATILVPQDHATIQGAIGAATDGDEVVVSPGIYDEDSVDFSGKKIVVRSINPLDPAVVAATVIDAGNRGSVVVFESGEGSLSVLRGFSLRAGLAQRGGGIRCVGSAPMIDHCAIGPNQADDGGGVSAEAPGRPTLAYCNIVDNLAESGGGVYARGEGGGIRIENCAIRRNASTGTSAPGGGALALHLQSYSSILNSYITGNSAVIGGAIDQRYQGKSFLLHTTIAFNEGDGIVVSSSDYATLVNCILWGNEGEQIDGSASFVEVYHCDVEGGFEGGIGNIDSDPAFVDASADNHRLALTSPCIDAGTDVKTTAFDHDGEPRPYGTGIDIGADEASPPLYLELSNLPAEVMTGDSLSYGILAINPSALPQELDSLVVSYSWPQGAEDLVYSGAPISVAPSDTVAWQALTIPAVMGEYEVGARAYRSGDLVGARDRPLVVRPKDRTIRVPADYTTIQSALAFAADGEEVVVAPGTHWEHDIDFLGKGVTVRGESPEDSATVATTVVDANGLGRVFHFSAEGSSPATLAGLTIRGGNVVEELIGHDRALRDRGEQLRRVRWRNLLSGFESVDPHVRAAQQFGGVRGRALRDREHDGDRANALHRQLRARERRRNVGLGRVHPSDQLRDDR